MVCLVIALLFILPINRNLESTAKEYAFTFQPDNKPSNESRVILFLQKRQHFPAKNFSEKIDISNGAIDLNKPRELWSLSLSVWFNVLYYRDSTYMFSYAISDENSNVLNFAIRPNKISIALHGSISKIKRTPVWIQPRKWHLLGLSIESLTGDVKVYLNGELCIIGKVSNISTPLNGTLVLGQETDKLGGGFVAQQSFSGSLAEFNLHSRVLSKSDFLSLFSCSGDNIGPGDIVSWDNANTKKWTMLGNVKREVVNVCHRKSDVYIPIIQNLNFYEARSFCKRLFKTEIFIPRNMTVNDRLYQDSHPFFNQCKPDNHGFSYFWLGATDKVKNGHWLDLKGYPLNFTQFPTSTFSAKQLCVAFDTFGVWNDVFCKSLKFCFACEVPEISTVLRLRGLCYSVETSVLFRVSDMNKAGGRNIDGYSRHKIIYNDTVKLWLLQDAWLGVDVASYFDISGLFPLGTKTWLSLQDYLVCGLPKDKLLPLTLSRCTNTEYSCRDGQCIDLFKRCDLITDCNDNSDEDMCEKAIIPQNYMKQLPPPGKNGEPMKINVTINVDKISEIDVLNMKLRINFIIELVWFDPRLTYVNLNQMDDINMVNVHELWVPEIEYTNADFESLYEMTPTLTVRRQAKPRPDDLSRYFRDNQFLGRNNPLILRRRVSAFFHCPMDLAFYPFDTQNCLITFKLKTSYKITQWGIISVTYQGIASLQEYLVEKTNSWSKIDKNYSIGNAKITLKRLYSYHISSVYMPTFMLLIISYASLFCRLQDKDLRIMMTITTLLVLYSLYQQISSELPKTSYAKIVDVWCFFSLTVICSQVFFHVMINATFSLRWRIGGSYSDNTSTDNTSREYKRMRIYKNSRLLYLIFIVLFILGYVAYIAYHVY